MNISVGMPYSRATLEPDDKVTSVNKLKRLLTATMVKFDPQSNHQTIKLCLFEDMPFDGTSNAHYRFRTGLLYRIQQMASLCNLSVQVIDDDRPTPKPNQLLLHGVRPSNIALYDYQETLVDQKLKNDMGILCAATGGGKTYMAAAMIAKRSVRALVLVHTVDLLEQTRSSFEKIFETKIGAIGDGIYDPQPITVGMVQTLINVKQPPEFDMVIVDETHHLPADTFFEVTAKFKARYVYGLSATPYRLDKADLLIEAGAGPIMAKVSPSELIRKKRLARPVNRFIPVPQQTDFNRRMPGWMAYKKYIVNNDWRNAKIAQIAKEHVDKGETFLIYVRQIAHAKKIVENLHVPYVTLDGKDDSKYRKQTFEKLRTKEIKLVISTLVKEGVDIPSLDAMFNAAGGVDTMQLVGRALRMSEGKTIATIYDFVDNQHIVLQGASWARINRLKEESEFIVLVG
jgi:superfamily II DNA or RNA helicase